MTRKRLLIVVVSWLLTLAVLLACAWVYRHGF